MVTPSRSASNGSTISPCGGERALCQPGRPGRHRRLQAGHHAQAGEDVIGSHGGCDLPYDKVEYRTRCGRRPRKVRQTAASQPGGRPADGRRTSACPASSCARPALPRPRGTPPRPPRRPPARPAAARSASATASIRSARLPSPATTASRTSRPGDSAASSATGSSAGSTGGLQADLQVLGLAGHPGRRGAGVRDLRVRAEALRVGHRYGGPAQRTLERPGEVPVRGEPQRSALGVPDPDPLDDRGLAADWLVLGDGRRPSSGSAPR